MKHGLSTLAQRHTRYWSRANRIIAYGSLYVGLLSSAAFPLPAYAEGDADCAIWLCLPMGFPSGCGDAFSAFKDRIKSFKPPLPALHSCLISSDVPTQAGNITSTTGYAAVIAEHKVCSEWKRERHGGESDNYCQSYKTIPSHVKKGIVCQIDHKERTSSPQHCYRTVRYVDTYMDGKPYGETFYFDKSGNKYIPPFR